MAGAIYAILSTDPYIFGNGSNLEHFINFFALASLALRDGIARVVGGWWVRASVWGRRQRLAKDQDHKIASRILLTPRQIAESAWQVPCTCGAIPEGPVRSTTQIDIEFRCPNGHCESTNYRNRLCLLDIALVDRCTKVFGMDIRAVVTKALALPRSMPRGMPSSRRGLVPIRLTLFEDNMLSDQDIELALLTLVETGH